MPADPADMLLFAAVVRAGGFSAASRALGLTKQSLSQRVARLEEQLGVRLLERTTRQVRPTEAGARYFDQCAAIEDLIREADEGARRLQAEPVGQLRISAPALFGRRLLAPLIPTFLERYPRVRVDLILSERRVDLVAEGFDLAVRVGPLTDPGQISRRLGSAPTAIVASPAWLAAHPDPSPATLHEAPALCLREGETWTFHDQPVPVRPRFIANDLEILREAAVAGAGPARLPLLACADDLRRGALVRLPGAPEARVDIHAVLPSRAWMPLRVRAFLDLLTAYVADDAELGG